MKICFTLPLAVLLTAGFACPVAMAQEAKPDAKVTFDDHVKPILVQRCSSCHSNNKKEADLDVTNYTSLMMGGGSGEVIAAGDSGASYMYKLITHEDSPEMPPSGTKIPDAEIKLIAAWIDGGALENAGSKPRKAKPKMDMALGESATTRPEVVATPLRMPLEPVIKTERPSALAIATSPWAALAAISSPKQVLLYDLQSLELVGILPMEEGVAHTLRFSRNGSLLLAGGGKDGQLGKTIIWDVKTGDRVVTVGEELDTVLAADISATHEYVAMGGPNKLVKIFRVGDEQPLFEIKKHTDWVTAMEFSPDGKMLATGDRNGGVHVWEVETGSELFTLKGHTQSISGISWRSDSKIVATASEDATIRTWEMNRGGQLKSWGAHGGGVTSIEFLRDGNIASCGRDKIAKTWDQEGKLLQQFTGLTDVSVAVSYCDETARIIAADWAGEVRVWNAADGAHIGNLAANPPTIAERIAASEAAFNAAKQKYDPLAAKAQELKTQLDQMASTLATSKQTMSEMTVKFAETEKKMVAVKQQFDSTSAQHDQWRNELTEKNTAKPLIAEALAKATAAAQTLAADAELKQTVAQLQNKDQAIVARITELTGLVNKANEEKTTTKAQLDQLTAALAGEKQEMDKLASQITQLESQVETMTTQVDAETKNAQAAQAELEQAKQQVDRWKGHLAFIEQLKTLKSQLDQTEQVIQERQAAVHQAEEKLAAAQAIVDQANQAKKQQVDQANSLKQQILKIRGGQ